MSACRGPHFTVCGGIDSGGSKTRLAVRRPGGDVLTVEGASGNVSERGACQVARTMLALFRKAVARLAPCRFRHVCSPGSLRGRLVVGTAGAGTDELRRSLERHISHRLPGMSVLVVSDLDLAERNAFGENGRGMVMVVGTGTSMRYSDGAGRSFSAGGWGPLAGDVGGGYWLGMRLLGHVADYFDGVCKRDDAVARFLEGEGIRGRNGFKDWLRTHGRRRRLVAAVAPVVMRCLDDGDPWAAGVCEDACRRLAGQAGALLERTGVAHESVDAVMVGGLVENPGTYREMLASHCEATAGLHVMSPPRPAELGALAWAEELESFRGGR